jgi:hypothetical protein
MVPAATLKVFEPLARFDDDERSYWESYASGEQIPPPRTVLLDREHGLEGSTATLVAEREHGELIERRGVMYVCPHRTKLRLLASVLAFRRSIPAEVVRAFMPEDEVERAAEEIESLRTAHPAWRNHILESSWEVPLHWFVAFDDAERRLIRNPRGSPGLRYETIVGSARERCAHALGIVKDALPNPAIIAPLAGLTRWFEDFDEAGLLVLDYADVAALLPGESLRRDHSCRDIWSAIRALSEGDGDRATAYYMVAAERWSGVRRRESLN